MFFYRFVIRHWLLLMQLRHYTAFVAICSRVTKRPVHDVSDLRFTEAFLIWYKFSTDSFASYNAFLNTNTSAKAQDDFLSSITFNDRYRRLRTLLLWVRRLTFVLILLFSVLTFLGLLGPFGIAFLSFLPFVLAAFVAYYFWLNLRCKRLHKLFPQACREWIAQLRLDKRIKSNSVHHLRQLPLYTLHNLPRAQLFSPLETLTLRSLRDFRVRQDAHAPIADNVMRIAKLYPQGIKNYLLELSKSDNRYADALRPLQLEHNAPVNTYTLTALMYDDTMLEIIQKIIRNSERVILLASAAKVENLKSLIRRRQPDINLLAENVMRTRLPHWRSERQTILLDDFSDDITVLLCHQDGNRYWKEDIQTFLYFFIRENGDAHTRIVTDDEALRTFLTNRYISHVQSDFSNILLHKQNDPDLVTIVLTHDIHAARQLTIPLNYILVVINNTAHTSTDS